MKRRATTLLVSAAAVAGFAAGPLTVPAAAQVTNEALISYVGPKKLKIGKKITYGIVCASDCNVTVVDITLGPKFKDADKLSGQLTATIPAGVTLTPNGPLLKALKAFPGRFKIKSTVTATNPVTGEVDTDKRTFRLKR